MRSVIAESWRRASTSGLRTDSDVRVDFRAQENDTALIRAADPVITDLAQQLEETSCALLLADRTQRIVLSRFSRRQVGKALDSVAAVPGSVYTEQTSGTNAISTVFETGQGSYVLGEEHYLHQLRQFRCYGHPIRHPITGVLEGVLDITGLDGESEGLMRALVVSAARAVEGRLLVASPTAHARLLSAYQLKSARSRYAVVAFGRDITLSNDAASRFLDETMIQELRAGCASWLGGSDGRSFRVTNPHRDEHYQAHITPVEGAPDSFIVEIKVNRSTSLSQATSLAPGFVSSIPRRAAVPSTWGGNLLVEGEPGSGRSTAALATLDGASAIHLDPVATPHEAVQKIRFATEESVVVLNDLDRFDTPLAESVASAVCSSGVRVIGTVEDSSRHIPEALGHLFSRGQKVLPLRRRLRELPTIVRQILRERDGCADMHVSTAAMDRLLCYSWPGNITELEAVLAQASAVADRIIDVQHLPTRVALATNRHLSPLEEAEYRTLVDALERHGGHKSRVAQELGIGRTTLYRRMRTLRLPS